MLGPLKRIKTSKHLHGWLNTGRQKQKVSPDATDAHQCPRCHTDDETQEHILTCSAPSAQRKRYELVRPLCEDIQENQFCHVQQTFTWCLKSWLLSSETPQPDVSQVTESQRELLDKALEEQEKIGWHLAMRGYLSKYWLKAVMVNPRTAQFKGKGKNWSRKAILLLWTFAADMWEHRNAVLHNHELEESRKIRDADINDEIKKLYAQVESYAAKDRWYFEMPLVLRLRKPLRSRRRWLVNARMLAAKSNDRINIGQTPLTTFFQPVPSTRNVVTRTLGPAISTATEYVQTTLFNLQRWRPTDPTSRPP